MKEEWRDTDFKGYQVSNIGNVRSIDRIVADGKGNFRKRKGQIMGGGFYRNGYTLVVLSVDNVHTTTSKHILVAKAFIPNPENKRCVNHKNSIRTDNRVENLEWVTHKENSRHGVDFGKIRKGESISWSKLTEKDVIYIKNNDTIAHKDLADEFNVSRALITMIKNGKRWRHLGQKVQPL